MNIQSENQKITNDFPSHSDRFDMLENLYETKYADISNGERIGYREVGEGTTMILLHGNFTCSNVMEPIM